MTLCAESIGKTFGERRVLASARLSVEAGQVVGLLGRMGSGKSTLLRICAGLATADSGWVKFAGEQHERPRFSRLARRGLFFLSEEKNLAPSLTVSEHLDEIDRRFGPRDRDYAVGQMELESLLTRRAGFLSGGEAKRVEFSMAMVRRPVCFLADEPFRSVDPKDCESLGAGLRSIAARGCAVVITGHQVNVLRPFIDRVTWVTSGTTYDLGPTDSAWMHDAFAREYLGTARSGAVRESAVG